MKCLVLAAGYGTRMQNLIGPRPKALIELRGRTLLDRLVTDIRALGMDITLVSNRLYLQQFHDWRSTSNVDVEVLDDGSTHVDNRLGAIGDIAFAIEAMGLADDLLVVAADNLFTFSLAGMMSSFDEHGDVHLAVWENPDPEDQKHRGVVTLGANREVLSFVEKPQRPTSNLAAAPIYILPGELRQAPRRYLDMGGNPDAPGHLIAHLVERVPMRAWQVPGEILDVGNPESYARALSMTSLADE